MSKQNVSTFTASKSAGKLYFSLISGVKMPQICSICEKSAYYMAESGVKGALSAVQSGVFGEIRSIIGRHEEKKVLQRCVDSERAEFVAIYGRRRIGKTFLVKQFFESSFDFYTTGVYQVSRSEQLKNWQKQLLKYSKQRRNTPKDWFEAFDQLLLKTSLLQDGQTKWYFVVWFLSATGARVGELVKLKVEHVECGFFDIYGKGGKLRRLYIPETLQKEALKWLAKDGRSSGYLFLNRFGKQITPRGIASQLKTFAKKYGLDEAVVYPHSFRHRFAKNFLEKRNDIALLADLMGHEHIETTRIYLRQTASEQREVVNKVVTW